MVWSLIILMVLIFGLLALLVAPIIIFNFIKIMVIIAKEFVEVFEVR